MQDGLTLLDRLVNRGAGNSSVAPLWGIVESRDPGLLGGDFGGGLGSLVGAVTNRDARNRATQQQAQQIVAGTQARQAAASASVANRVPSSIPAEYQPLVAAAAQKFGVDPSLVAAVIQQESGFQNGRTSPAGAQGLGQLMPGTAQGLGVTDPWNPEQNINATAQYLAQNLRAFGGDVPRALAAYNAGPGAVQQFGGVPPYEETQRYVRAVQGYYDQFRGQTVQAGPATVAAGPLAGVSQYDLGLPREIADAFCGPAAALAFARATGRNPTVGEALDLAKQVGWTTGDAGMGGPQRAVALMQRLGAPATLGPVDAGRIQQEIAAGRPVVIDTPGHYYQIVGYNAATGGFIMGDAVGRRQGAAGVRLEALASLGYGGARTAIYLGQGQ